MSNAILPRPMDQLRLTEAETIALAYYRAHGRDGWAALVHALEDALTDLGEREATIRAQGQAISRGYVRRPVDG